MKRFVVALVLLAGIIATCFYSLFIFRSTGREVVASLSKIELAAAEGERPKVLAELCEEHSDLWIEREKKLLRFIRHPQLDEVCSLTAELQYLATDDSPSHLLAAIARIKINIERIGDAELFGG